MQLKPALTCASVAAWEIVGGHAARQEHRLGYLSGSVDGLWSCGALSREQHSRASAWATAVHDFCRAKERLCS